MRTIHTVLERCTQFLPMHPQTQHTVSWPRPDSLTSASPSESSPPPVYRGLYTVSGAVQTRESHRRHSDRVMRAYSTGPLAHQRRGPPDDGCVSCSGAYFCTTCTSTCGAGNYLYGCGGASAGSCQPCPSGSYSGSGKHSSLKRGWVRSGSVQAIKAKSVREYEF